MAIAEIASLVEFIVKQFGLSKEEARAAAEAAWAEIERLRKMGSPTALTDAALAEPPAKPQGPEEPA